MAAGGLEVTFCIFYWDALLIRLFFVVSDTSGISWDHVDSFYRTAVGISSSY